MGMKGVIALFGVWDAESACEARRGRCKISIAYSGAEDSGCTFIIQVCRWRPGKAARGAMPKCMTTFFRNAYDRYSYCSR